ncbi:MAG: mannose-1-phosphate guanylyltransferase [Planctomycetes bacterium]|nr:mannose-1-phosphate guanylyltransferase [Planctomycetota bacterium]
MLYAVIMAGGSGTRFWPESRAERPKQLLRLAGSETMIRATVNRAGELAPASRIRIITSRALAEPIREELPELPPAAVIAEPCRRDTAPCIGLAAQLLLQEDPDAVMAVMPSDHIIQATEKFQAALKYAAALIEKQPRRLVTFGIRPTYPAETFGYIERGEPLSGAADDPPTFRVQMFREKPNAAAAREYLESGRFLWNSGIFVWRADTIDAALAKLEPAMHAHLAAIGRAAGDDETLQREFEAIRGKSIDYAVMERYNDVVVIEAPFDWDDVGSWRSLARLHGTDENGNTVIGRHIGMNSQGLIVRGDDERLIVTLGMKDCIIVHTPDATLVADKNNEEAVRDVVEELKRRGWDEFL